MVINSRDDLKGLSRKELKDIIMKQNKQLNKYRKQFAKTSFIQTPPHRDMSDMSKTYYNPYEFGRMWHS